MNNKIVLNKMGLKIDTNSLCYYVLVSNPFYGIEWKYEYSGFMTLPDKEFVTLLLEPAKSYVPSYKKNKQIEYAFNYRLFGCDFFKEKRLHTAIPEFLFDELEPIKLNSVEYLASMIYLNHKKFLKLTTNIKGFNIIPKKIIKQIII